MRILMVDDSAADRRLCRILLEEKFPGLRFEQARTGMDGLSLCRIFLPDCVLLDYRLPDMDGLEFIDLALQQAHPNSAILAVPSATDVPPFALVMLTGLGNEKVAIRALKNGAQDYLGKDQMTAESLAMAVDKATEKVRLIRELKEERDRLAESLEEKEVLLQEIHHRVKNNLQVISSLLRMQADNLSQQEDSPPAQRTREALRESQHRVESMAFMHEQLYQTADLREVDLAQHAALVADNLVHSYAGHDPDRIQWRVNLESLPLPLDKAIPAGLILNELVSNALKHAFPESDPNRHGRGCIWIEGGPVPDESATATASATAPTAQGAVGNSANAGWIELRVRDNGIGMSPDVTSRQPHTLGLQIVKILTRQIKGQLEIGTPPDGGTQIRIRFATPSIAGIATHTETVESRIGRGRVALPVGAGTFQERTEPVKTNLAVLSAGRK
jgi:two-component sensor histidine kinase/CheY-like chemotaxis protein